MRYQLPYSLSIATDGLCDTSYLNKTDLVIMNAIEEIPYVMNVNGVYVFTYQIKLNDCKDWNEIRVRCEDVVKQVEKILVKLKVPRTSSLKDCTLTNGSLSDTLV